VAVKMQPECTARTVACMAYFTKWLELLLYRDTVEKVLPVFNDFCNSQIPGLGRRQSWDSGLAKTALIPGLQPLE